MRRSVCLFLDPLVADGPGTHARAADSNLFTGVHGNYLRASIENNGLDPDNLPESDPSTMSFGAADDKPAVKAWKDVWGCGQGIGTIKSVRSAAEAVDKLAAEYADAVAALKESSSR